ncbi:hypothetical protein niasHT_000294 [Heterodera trifolii]|uniref:Uncharacterized protein n=1 Tax=Heterodera trifolii TaxID=157864 RepID=A0ABD2LTL3_9BILA
MDKERNMQMETVWGEERTNGRDGATVIDRQPRGGIDRCPPFNCIPYLLFMDKLPTFCQNHRLEKTEEKGSNEETDNKGDGNIRERGKE